MAYSGRSTSDKYLDGTGAFTTPAAGPDLLGVGYCALVPGPPASNWAGVGFANGAGGSNTAGPTYAFDSYAGRPYKKGTAANTSDGTLIAGWGAAAEAGVFFTQAGMKWTMRYLFRTATVAKINNAWLGIYTAAAFTDVSTLTTSHIAVHVGNAGALIEISCANGVTQSTQAITGLTLSDTSLYMVRIRFDGSAGIAYGSIASVNAITGAIGTYTAESQVSSNLPSSATQHWPQQQWYQGHTPGVAQAMSLGGWDCRFTA